MLIGIYTKVNENSNFFTVIYKLDACRTIVRFDGKAKGDTVNLEGWEGEGDNIYQEIWL